MSRKKMVKEACAICDTEYDKYTMEDDCERGCCKSKHYHTCPKCGFDPTIELIVINNLNSSVIQVGDTGVLIINKSKIMQTIREQWKYRKTASGELKGI